MKNLTYIFLILGLIQACDRPIDLDIDQVPPKLVIQGQVTDQKEKSFIYLTWSNLFYDAGDPRVETGGYVVVKDGEGNEVVFEHNPDSLGMYLPPTDFVGVKGKIYTLEIEVDGVDYSASDTLPGTAAIDSLTSSVNVRESLDPDEEGRFYDVKIYGKEPKEELNFYMFRFYRNDTIVRRFSSDIFVTDDTFLGEEIKGFPFPFYSAESDKVVLEMYGISRNAFIYYSDLQLVLGNDGGMFSPPPANPRSNIDGDALGFFLVSSIASDTLIVSK